MKNVVLSVMLVATLTGTIASASAQTIQATGPKLYKGLTMKAEQHCPRFPGQGVTFTVESVNQSGTGGEVSVEVSCWGNWAVLNGGAYRGSIIVEGSTIALRFYTRRSINIGANLSGGAWQTDATGKAMLVFGKSEFRAEEKVYANELVFR